MVPLAIESLSVRAFRNLSSVDLELGQRLKDLARDQVKAARPGVEADLLLDPHGSQIPGGAWATRMSTFSPRKGMPSRISNRRWRSPLASEPSARTIRCQGNVGS